MAKTYYMKGVNRVKKNICTQMFYNIVVLESFFNNKVFLIKLQASVFPLKCFFLSPLKIKQRFSIRTYRNTWLGN